jgi:hypothetical protein
MPYSNKKETPIPQKNQVPLVIGWLSETTLTLLFYKLGNGIAHFNDVSASWQS